MTTNQKTLSAKELIEELRPKLQDYLQSKGVVISDRGMAKCPLPSHHDTNGSFSVGGPMGDRYFKCHGCDAKGDIFELASQLDGLPDSGEAFYTITLSTLASMFNLNYDPKKNMSPEALRRHTMLKAYRDAVRILKVTPKLRKYMKSRGWTEQTFVHFQVGTVISFQDFMQRMESLGYERKFLTEIGLGPSPRVGKKYAAEMIFQPNRMIIPIKNLQGNPVAFTARRIDNSDGPKYVNSANWELFRKQDILFNMNARTDSERIYIVEGAADVLTSYQFGFPNTVGLNGVSLSDSMITYLNEQYQIQVLVLDGDEAGQEFIHKHIGKLQNPRVLFLPSGDPDSFLMQHSREAFLNLEELMPLAWYMYYHKYQQPEQEAEKILHRVAQENPVYYEYFLNHLATASQVELDTLRLGLHHILTQQSVDRLNTLIQESERKPLYVTLNVSSEVKMN